MSNPGRVNWVVFVVAVAAMSATAWQLWPGWDERATIREPLAVGYTLAVRQHMYNAHHRHYLPLSQDESDLWPSYEGEPLPHNWRLLGFTRRGKPTCRYGGLLMPANQPPTGIARRYGIPIPEYDSFVIIARCPDQTYLFTGHTDGEHTAPKNQPACY